jgi:hypothetical protein
VTAYSALLDAVFDRLRDRAVAATDPLVTVGERVLLVEVDHPDSGHLAGLAHRPPGDADLADRSSVVRLAALATDSGNRLERAAGIATLNALSVPDVDWQAGDPMAALPADVDVVAGALVTDVDRVRERVTAGDCGTDLHDAGVEKVYVADTTGSDGIPASLGLEASRPASPGESTQTGRGPNANDRQ